MHFIYTPFHCLSVLDVSCHHVFTASLAIQQTPFADLITMGTAALIECPVIGPSLNGKFVLNFNLGILSALVGIFSVNTLITVFILKITYNLLNSFLKN